MSISLSVVEQTAYDSMVKAEYRSKGFRLRDAVKMRRDVIGATCDFRKAGQVISTATGYLQAVTLQDPNYAKATATLQKYTTPTGS